MSALQHRDEVFNAALKLAESDRWTLVSQLLASMPEDMPGLDGDEPEFHEELVRRSGDDQGAIAWEELRDELRTNS